METEHTSSVVRWALLGIVLLFIGVILFSHHITTNRDKQVSVPLPTKYSNYVYKMSLEYPAEWQPNPDYNYDRYDGADGFFMLSASGPTLGATVDSIANTDRTHYGAKPAVSSISVDGQEARLILGTGITDTESDEAELIVKYPKPITVSGQTYHFLVIKADAGHIRSIADSVKFIK